MFSGLRPGSPFFIFSKSEPTIEIGEVIGVSNPVPQYPSSFNSGAFQLPVNMVDVKVKVSGEEVEFNKLRADLSIADTNNGMVVVSDSRDAMISEVEGYQKISQRALDDMDKHKHVVDTCTELLAKLSPQIQRDVQQAAEIEGLKKEMNGINSRFDKLETLLAKALKTKTD